MLSLQQPGRVAGGGEKRRGHKRFNTAVLEATCIPVQYTYVTQYLSWGVFVQCGVPQCTERCSRLDVRPVERLAWWQSGDILVTGLGKKRSGGKTSSSRVHHNQDMKNHKQTNLESSECH